MVYKKIEQTIVVRLDPGDDIYTCLLALSKKEAISLATVQGLGAVDHVIVGLFDPVSKEYHQNEFKNKDFEIVSLTGNISSMNSEPYLHIHMAVADKAGNVYGGHLNKAVVSATSEIFIGLINGSIDRYFDEKIGLNLLDIK